MKFNEKFGALGVIVCYSKAHPKYDHKKILLLQNYYTNYYKNIKSSLKKNQLVFPYMVLTWDSHVSFWPMIPYQSKNKLIYFCKKIALNVIEENNFNIFPFINQRTIQRILHYLKDPTINICMACNIKFNFYYLWPCVCMCECISVRIYMRTFR